MTFSVLGIETNQVKETDPRTGREKVFYLPKTSQQTGIEEKVRLPKTSRLQGTYIIGATGAGKSGLLENLIMQDISQQTGVFVIDPHGDLINKVIARLSDDQVERVILLDFEDTKYEGTDYYPGLNIYQCDDPMDDDLVTETHGRIEHLFDVVTLENSEEKLGVRVSQGIRNSSYTLMDSSPAYGCTMLELPLLFQEDVVRTKLASHLTDVDATVKAYWQNYERFDRVEKASRADMVVNKIEGYIINRKLRRIIGQSRTTINFREVMDCKPGKIVLVKLPGDNERMTELLGKLLIAQLLAAAMSRRTTPLWQRKQCNIYCDEYERYNSDDFTRLLKECRKYGMAVTIAHQSRDFIDLRNKAASLQVANLIVLRIIRKDADEVAGNFDCTPIRTKKVLKRRTKPVFREWDEYFWDSEESEKYYNEELVERIAEAERSVTEADKRAEQAFYCFRCAKALIDHFFSYAPDCQWYPDNESDYSQHAHSFKNSHSKLKPIWLMSDGQFLTMNFTTSYAIGWTEEDIHAVERGLVLRDFKSETVHEVVHYGREKKRSGAYVSCTLPYSYEKRVEWYSISGRAAISGLEYVLGHRTWPRSITTNFETWKGADTYDKSVMLLIRQETNALFSSLLGELIAEIHAFIAPFYERTLLKFYPNLAPLDWSIEEIKYGSGLYKEDVPHLSWPLIAALPQPEIGQRRNTIGLISPWMADGRWEPEPVIIPSAESWLESMADRLKARVRARKKELEQRKQELAGCKQRVSILTQQREAYKKEHYKPIHHKEYLGEQPEVMERTRISHSYSQGSSVSTSHKWPGKSESHGASSSHSVSYSTDEVQWYDLVDELDQTHDQRRDEIANEIANFPDYVARVKIKDEHERIVEYTIRTLAPERGLPEKALKARIARIKETMIEQNIIRPQHAIDEEITKRQQLLRLPPPENEQPVTRRPPH